MYFTCVQGGFPFSTRDCGWIVADCTAEGLKSVMLLQKHCWYLCDHVADERLQQAVDVVSFKSIAYVIIIKYY